MSARAQERKLDWPHVRLQTQKKGAPLEPLERLANRLNASGKKLRTLNYDGVSHLHELYVLWVL